MRQFEIESRKVKKQYTVIQTRISSPDQIFRIYLDKDTGTILYPLFIEPVLADEGVRITLDSDTHASCSFPPTVPESMIDNLVENLNEVHDLIKMARELIKSEQQLWKQQMESDGT